jgi:UDP-3-O-[3-hydroxymyristoyl] N-acetylglucosamine deacetylase
LDAAIFLREIAPARTFGFMKDKDVLRENGFARGASLENTVVLDEQGIVNGPLRFQDEFVRHKILDLIGDLALFGRPLLGHFSVKKGGHELHHSLVRHLKKDVDLTAPF